MLKQIEGSRAVAEAVAMCRPQVICAYPITPQTHIVEALSAMVKKDQLAAEFLNVESEFAAMSVAIGASAASARAYTATRAMDFRGARYLYILVPYPLGWGSSPADTVKVARLATESGLFPVLEAEAGPGDQLHPGPPPGASHRLPAHPGPVRAPVQARRKDRGHRAHPGGRQPQHPQVRAGPTWYRTGRGCCTRIGMRTHEQEHPAGGGHRST
jgi:hypothetical protein